MSDLDGDSATLVRPEPDEILQAFDEWRAIGRETFEEATCCLVDVMTKARAKEVRAFRIGQDGHVSATWREVSKEFASRWKAPWKPDWSQLWGMALCRVAAGFLGEDWREAPWN